MAGKEPFAAVLSALRRCYAQAVPLETFVRLLGDGGAGDPEVLRADDAAGYRTFVGQCLVCVPRGARAIPRPFTFQQLSSQSEVTARIVQRLCEKKKKNILAYGYSLPDERSSQFPVMPFSKIHSYLPNTATETLCISGFWETLLSRIGDDVMMYLLEHCAIFMLVPPSNCYQVCGQPVYQLISHNVDSSLLFLRQRVSKRKCTSLLKYTQKRLKFHRNYFLKSCGWKYRQRHEGNVSRMGNKRNNERKSLVSGDQCSAKAGSEASEWFRMVTEHQEKQSSSSSCVSATAPSRKRKIHREQPEISVKRAKIEEKVEMEKACSLTPDVNQSSSERSETGCVAPHSERVIKTPAIYQRSNSDVSVPSLVHTSCSRKKVVAGKSSLLQGIQSNKPLESNTEMQAESHRKRAEMHTYKSRLASGQTKPVEDISSKCRRQESPQPHLSKKLPNRLLGSAVYIERKSLLYSCRNFRECFPKSFVLNRLQGFQAGGRWLVEAIFLSQNQVQQRLNQNQVQQRLNQNREQQGLSQNQDQQRRNQNRKQRRRNQNQEQQRLNQNRKQRRQNQNQEQQKDNQNQEQQRLNQNQEQQRLNQNQEQQRLNQNQEQQRLNQNHKQRRHNQNQEQQRLNQNHEQRRHNQNQEQQKHSQNQDQQRRNQNRKQQGLNQNQEQQGLNQNQEQQRLNQNHKQRRQNQNQEQQKHNQNQEQQRHNQNQVQQRRNQNRKQRRLNQNREQQGQNQNQVQQRRNQNRKQRRCNQNREQQGQNQNQEQQGPNESQPKRKRRKMMPKRYWQMRHTFQKLVKNHGKCAYLALLRRNCPLRISKVSMRAVKLSCQAALPGEADVQKQAKQFGKKPAKCVTSSRCESGHTDMPDNLGAPLAESVRGESLSEEQNARQARDSALRELLKQHSSHWQVYMFVRECLEEVVPAELWGSNHNKCRFLKNVKVFISRGKFAKLSLQELMWRMRVNDCMWLRLGKGNHFVPADEHCFREELLAKFLYWLMNTYVVELLRSFFYITETMFQKNMLFYYRKVIWGKLQSIGIRNHLFKVQLQPLSSEEVETIRQKKFVPVASKLRFIPKRNGLRPILKVSSVVKPRTLSKESREKKMNHYNTQLKNLFSVLNYERTKNTSIIGSSVFGRDDIYKTWKQFVTKILESGGEIPHFYCVKADVSRAFDTIPHNKLVEVISRVLKPEKRTVYCIRRYAVIMITPSGKARRLYRRHVSTFKDFMPDMKQFVSQLQEEASLQNSIVVEQSLTFNETSSSLFNFFLQMLHNIILKIRNSYYLQCCGIPQGSILSTLLCSLFYGDMENKLFSGIQQDGVLIRLIDDFLLLTPHLTKARTFLRTLATGIPEYGLLINPNKTVVNFPVDDIPGCSTFKQLPDCLLPWCGLLLDLKTLEVYCDYSSYAYTSIRASLSFNSSRTAGKNMKHKLSAVFKLKCHSLFLDLQINSLRTVLINIYKIFLLQAYRFHACVLQLPFNQQVRNNPYFFLRIISETASCCHAILKRVNAGIAGGNKGVSDILPIQVAEWLCYHAFTVKLSNHRAVYKCLLTRLKVCKMKLIRKIPEATVELLEAVTEPSFCQDFKAILD